MQICERCRADQAVTNSHGVGLCHVCAHVLGIGQSENAAARVGQASAEPASFPVDPFELGQSAGKKIAETPPPVDPYAMGQRAGGEVEKGGGISGTVGKISETAKSVSSTVKTVAIVGGLVGVGVLGYLFYRAHQAEGQARRTIAEHPELLKLL